MLLSSIESVDQVTDEQVTYLAGIAQNLSMESDYTIQNYADTAITSPDAQKALQSASAVKLLTDGNAESTAFASLGPANGGTNGLALSSFQEDALLGDFWQRIKNLFGGLRRKVKKIFCKVASALGNDGDLDLKKIIREVLIVLIPALAASAGLLPIALPIVVSLAAMLIKYGVDRVCPV